MKKDHFNQLKELHEDKKALALYNHYVLNELANLHPINLGCVVTKNYILDFLIFYFSVVESWTFYPYLVHVFTFEKETNDRIQSFNLLNVKIHLMNMNFESNWSNFATMKIKMVEWSGLERCIISDVDNIFLAETPELNFLLDKNDFVFIGAPHSEWILQTSLWSFRRNRHTLKFARK